MKKYLIWIPIIGLWLSDTPNLYSTKQQWFAGAVCVWQFIWLLIFVIFVVSALSNS